MPDTSPEDLIRQLEEELERETERADRAQVEAHIAWGVVATMRELLVKHRLNITMTRAYEPIKALEGDGLDREIDRRLTEKRSRDEARRLIQEGERLAAKLSPEDLPEED
jgi:hypothetical protein